MNHSTLIKDLSEKFRSGTGDWKSEEIAEQVWVFSSDGMAGTNSEPIELTFGAITHGNEIVGLGAFDRFLHYLASKKPVCNIAFFLGNPEACKKDVRYLERDLNRSFSAPFKDGVPAIDWKPILLEERRAVAIQKALARSKVLIDLHQTKCPSEKPFWILQMAGDHYKIARTIDPESPFVCYDGIFSADGDGTAEYVRRLGGVALTLESGQEGMHTDQIDFMVERMQRAFEVLSGQTALVSHDPKEDRGLYTWDQTIANSPQSRLVEGLKNFSLVQEGVVYGYQGDQELVAAKTAMSLFPKYPRPDQTKPSAELIRFLKPYKPVGQ